MTIKSVADSSPLKKESYPLLKERVDHETAYVVLFHAPNQGMVVARSKYTRYQIGFYTTSWMEKLFVPYQGKITLSNESE